MDLSVRCSARQRIQMFRRLQCRGLHTRFAVGQIDMTTFCAATAIVRADIASERQRDAVTLYYLEGMSTAQIADRMGLTDVEVQQLVVEGVREMVRSLGRRR